MKKVRKQEYIDSSIVWPRSEAARILKLCSRKEMDAELKKIKDPWNGWVKFYLNDWINKRGSLAKLKELM